MNWRKPLIYGLLRLMGSHIPHNLQEIQKLETLEREALLKYQREKLKRIILHSWEHVPYYTKILTECEVVKNKKFCIENFFRIPILTKKIIRENFDDLQSQDIGKKKRKPFLNTSGGSTGEPVRFFQDKYYSDWNIANKIYYKTFGDHQIGEKELRIWGSEKDLLEGKESFTIRLRNWLYNRRELNAFTMTPKKMQDYIKIWNRYKPQWIESYTHCMFEFARFIKDQNIKIYSPKGIITSAGTLYPHIQQTIEEVFQCKVLNRYGTREVGDVACSCPFQEGLHYSCWNQYVEILDNVMSPVSTHQIGKVYVTALNNFTMPLIRYQIGDIARVASQEKICSCGRSTPLMEKIEGREMSVFRTKDGQVIPGEFFIHFVGVVHNKGYISQLQVIQEEYDFVRIKVVINDQQQFETYKSQIIQSVRKVMGKECHVEFESVDHIPPLKSGKFLYTICNLR